MKNVPFKYVRYQGPVIGGLAKTFVASLRRDPSAPLPNTPTEPIEITLPPRAADLIEQFVTHIGGRPQSYAGVVPPHLFPQWTFALAPRLLAGLPYKLTNALNAGCRMEIRAPLPANEPLQVRAWLERVDETERRVLLVQRCVTGTASSPDALMTELSAIIMKRTGTPSGTNRDRQGAGTKKDEPAVPANAVEIDNLRLGPKAGRDFALLTGDFNPIHWVPAAGRASGFKGAILHGFGTFSRALESLIRVRLGGDPSRLASIEARFTRPVPLPGRVAVFVDDAGGLVVGDAPGARAYMIASYTTRASGEM
ncbi:hypothetical protein K8I61_08110 [bacterium]|nr:hypothetical protein [bacterium]